MWFIWCASGWVRWMRVVKSDLKVTLISGRAMTPELRRSYRFVMRMSKQLMLVS
jgi:hypothetical protein